MALSPSHPAPTPCCETAAPTRNHVWGAACPGALWATLWWVWVRALTNTFLSQQHLSRFWPQGRALLQRIPSEKLCLAGSAFLKYCVLTDTTLV